MKAAKRARLLIKFMFLFLNFYFLKEYYTKNKADLTKF